MPAVMEQIGKMPRNEQLRLANWILDGIQNMSNATALSQRIYRTTNPDPSLKGEICCDLFADESADWESA